MVRVFTPRRYGFARAKRLALERTVSFAPLPDPLRSNAWRMGERGKASSTALTKTKRANFQKFALFHCRGKLSVVDKLGKLYGLDDLAVLINAHITRSDLVDKDNFAVVIPKLEFDIPKVKTDRF